MDLQAFFAENLPPFAEESVVLSDRLPQPFRIRAISEEHCALLRRQSLHDPKSGEIDSSDFLSKLAAACVIEPDLQNAALQRSWGVLGTDALLRKMLSAGEFARLLERVQILCGFDTSIAQQADFLKKD
ncbi:MAG: phage tail assembly chaperone [Candidatus Merdivicinus sp.]|jgi:hypothetical protein